ncbi:hypothetical protein [Mucilaginibacter polytrichastri]|uniref:Peptidase S74 domain-containing protein n=1 Tax=Mucilaginibacter polytrichastri TaxID=1302689 RepID=A0A1Q5ZT20_9SPHI|nr:hypothetical protein [Mucilaginibacter polytrichastri]OKS84906.1 hypothetical protein RG47T_0344 [Mucilaginibacter polytrichastri]SFS47875.1 hypothetical protein SAMN04487890_101731 [Mucilaginibacter polytrichastri]
MKKLLLAILSLLATGYSHAQQWQPSNGNIYFNTGNVGIGTAAPGAKLEVAGTGPSLFLDNAQLSANRNPLTGTVVDAAKGSTVLVVGANSNGGNFQFYTSSATGGNVYERMRITEAGNIGIGTITPSAKLSIQGTGTTSNTGAPAIADLFGTYDRTRLTIGNSTVTQGGTRSSAIAFYSMNTSGSAYKTNWEIGNDIGAKGINDFYIFSADLNNAPFYISSVGNVGIGTSVPGAYKLAVAGPIHTQAVNVDMTGWSDDVFNSSYELKPLTSLKSYIVKNHHLPDMPSEDRVIKNGLDLGEISKIQTKKIEELTLYLIEKDRQLKYQQSQINDLKSQIKALLRSSNKQ